MAIFILVHGGLHGGWCWDAVVPLLRARGHVVLAPDLPGMGADTTPAADITLDRWGDFIADLARHQPSAPILVGHSRGGIVISEAGERAPEAIAGLVYVSAMLLPAGESMFGYGAAHLPHLSAGIIVSSDGLSTTYDPASAQQIFYNRTDAALAAAAVSRLTDEPIAPNATPIAVSSERFGRLRRAYIECSDDNTIPIAVQRQMQAALPCDPVITLDSDHSPFLGQVPALVDALVSIERAWG